MRTLRLRCAPLLPRAASATRPGRCRCRACACARPPSHVSSPACSTSTALARARGRALSPARARLPCPGPCAVAGPQPRLRQLCTLTHRPAGAPSYCTPTAGANIPFAAPASSCRWIDRLRRGVVTKPACRRRRLSPPIRPRPARRLRPRTIGTVPPLWPRTPVRRLSSPVVSAPRQLAHLQLGGDWRFDSAAPAPRSRGRVGQQQRSMVHG
jgi:hypothetical protein